jgi:trehalose/maltose hydrolase-like predicted phosphorylase
VLVGYFGTAFWDQDTFQAPPLMVFYPEIAHNLLQNRLFQLPAYKLNAKAFGFRGAYVPWEAGFTGGFARDDGCAHQEIHIAPDVSLFVKQYYQLTQNQSALKELFPLLEGVSDFLVSRVNRTDEQGWLSVETIIGADESTGRDNIDNDIWTNAASVLALETTLDAADILGMPITDEQRTNWKHAASKLKIGFFEGEHRLLHREYDQYAFDNGSKWLHTSVGQTDTVLLGFPLQFNESHRVWRGHKEQVRLNDIMYYQDHISPTGSYMTAGHYVIAWLERPHRSLPNASIWFAKGRTKNYAPWRIWSEHDSNDGGAVNFITAGGMFLQSLVFGYGGLRFDDKGVTMDPLLPPGVTSMRLRGLNYAGSEFDVFVDGAGSAQFSRRTRNGGSAVLRHEHDGGAYRLRRRRSSRLHLVAMAS